MTEPAGGPFSIRDLSVRCGRCMNFMTLAAYDSRGEWNAYTYVCESGCEPSEARTVLDVPAGLDLFHQRDPGCGGGCGS